jgi:hypothetical protein
MEVESVVFQRPAGDKRDFWVQCAETVTVLDRPGRREEVHVRLWHKADMAARAISAHNPLGHLLSAIRLSVPAASAAIRWTISPTDSIPRIAPAVWACERYEFKEFPLAHRDH